MEKGLILLAWFALTAFAVRPVPGRGIPLGRRLTRIYLTPRQAVIGGGILVAIGVAFLAFAGFRGELDLALVGAALGWLGGLYLFHGWRGGQ